MTKLKDLSSYAQDEFHNKSEDYQRAKEAKDGSASHIKRIIMDLADRFKLDKEEVKTVLLKEDGSAGGVTATSMGGGGSSSGGVTTHSSFATYTGPQNYLLKKIRRMRVKKTRSR